MFWSAAADTGYSLNEPYDVFGQRYARLAEQRQGPLLELVGEEV